MTNPVDKVNHVENFVRVKGRTKMIEGVFTASVAAEEGAIVYPDPGNAGQWTIADSTAGNAFGVIRQTIASTDSDYASTKTVQIEVPDEPAVEWEGTIGSGTFTAADVNKYCDLVDGVSVAVDTQSKNVVFVAGYVSATRGRFIFAGNLPAGLAMAATT